MNKIMDRCGSELKKGDVVTVLIRGPILVTGKITGVASDEQGHGVAGLLLEAGMAFDGRSDAVLQDVVKNSPDKSVEVVSNSEAIKKISSVSPRMAS